MMNKGWRKEQVKIKYQDHLRTASGGLFDPRARRRLMGLAKPYGGRYAQNSLINFWNRIKEDVANALVDLALFVEAAPIEKIDDVITLDTIKPLLNAYFQLEYFSYAERSIVKAEIAQEVVEAGFKYLLVNQFSNVQDYHSRIIKDALGVSQDLANRMKLDILKKEQEQSK